MSSDYFQFKQFLVHHNYSTMKVGTDAVLLGTLADVQNVKSILEIGCGSGVVSLIMAQRSSAKITAIDIHQASVWEARANFTESPWSDRLTALYISYQQFASQGNPARYDLIISNPPFFENDLKSADAVRNLARHNDELSTNEFLRASNYFLSESGIICVILPITEAQKFIREAEEQQFYLNKKIEIKPKPSKDANRVILTFSKQKNELKKEVFTIREDSNKYTEEYRQLTVAFYLQLTD